MNPFLQTPIEFLKGVGPQRADILRNEAGIFTFEDLLNYFPFRYINRTQYHTIAELPYLDSHAQIKGRIIQINEAPIGKQKKLAVKFQDQTGIIELVWFQGAKWIRPILKIGAEYQVFGKAKIFGSNWNIPHPEIIEWEKVKNEIGLQAVYPSGEKLNSKGFSSKGIEKITNLLVGQIDGKIEETLPYQIIQKLKLISKEQALKQIHAPSNEHLLQKARFRLKFEELFFLQLEMLMRKQISISKTSGHIFPSVGEHFNTFYNEHIPFDLTNAQKRVLKEVRKDFISGQHMNRLVQGDVGSGKTLVALCCMLIATGNQFQAALMAPTEILANQHFITLKEFLQKMKVKIEILTGSTKKKDRTILFEKLANGEIDILVGTHALLEDPVQFKNLGLVVIDEQHRFGVAQRAKMWKKNTIPPHVLIMTATPIPRTLAMTFYGDLDVSVIDELPPGRKPISTSHKFEASRLEVFGFIKKEIDKGRQVYIVYPLIQESESMDYQNLMDGFNSISRSFPLPNYRVSIVHGKMKPEDKDFEMQRFNKGETQIMVATTVIEVGVNVPNASVMIIESAERFGLSQLHQLRGRVGRGAEKSYCILMTGLKLSKESKKRMATMVRTNDGFEIAEVDLELRGPGDIMGTQQSGQLNLRIADLAKDGEIVTLAREEARTIIGNDPIFELPQNQCLKEPLRKLFKGKTNWSKIS